jgi:hypothetical protein
MGWRDGSPPAMVHMAFRTADPEDLDPTFRIEVLILVNIHL